MSDIYIVTKLHEAPPYIFENEVAPSKTEGPVEKEAMRLSAFGDCMAYEVSRYDVRENGYCHFMERVSVAVEGQLFSG